MPPELQIIDASLTPEGYFIGEARVTGVSVLDYTQSLGVWAYRPLREVKKQTSLDSLRLQPITFSHPSENVDSRTVQNVTIGWTGENVRFDDTTESVIVNFKITTDWAVKLVQDSMRAGQRIQFSVGAKARPVSEPGTYNGKPYQVWFKDIEYNHLALLIGEDGRYPFTGIVTDSKAAETWQIFTDAELLPVDYKQTEEVKTVKIKLPSGFEVEIADAEARYLENHLTEHGKLVQDSATLKGENDQLKKDLDKSKAQVMDAATVNNLVSQRLALALEAQPLLDSETTVEKIAAMDSQGIMESVLLANGYGQTELDQTKTEVKDGYGAYLRGAYSQIVKRFGENKSSEILDGAEKGGITRRSESGDIEIKDAYEEAKTKRAEALGGKK
jgi:hypothetical protein